MIHDMIVRTIIRLVDVKNKRHHAEGKNHKTENNSDDTKRPQERPALIGLEPHLTGKTGKRAEENKN